MVEKSENGFVVQELGGGTGTYDFDFLVMAVRTGHEDFQVIRPALDAQDGGDALTAAKGDDVEGGP